MTFRLRHHTDDDHSEIRKMLTCGSQANGFAVYQCLGRNGRDNPHEHVILAEGGFLPGIQQWRVFQYVSLSRLRLLWQQPLLDMMAVEFPERQTVIEPFWPDDPDGFYAYPSNSCQ